MSKAPTSALSLRALRREGYFAVPCEIWQPVFGAGFRRQADATHNVNPVAPQLRKNDLLGIADILALRPGSPPLLVQTTTKTNLAAHRRKALTVMLEQPKDFEQPPALALWLWLRAGGAFILEGWWQAENSRWYAVREEAAILHGASAGSRWVARTAIPGNQFLAFVSLGDERPARQTTIQFHGKEDRP